MNYRDLKLSENDKVLWPIVSWDPFESNLQLEQYPAPPTGLNWMGTDDRGRDVFTRLLYGYRYTLLYAISVWFFSFLIGTILGAILGYFGGWVDIIGSRSIELWEMIPQTLLLITLISIFEPSIYLLIIFSVFFDWTGIFHQMRGQFLQLRKKEYVEAARILGASHLRVMFGHILPNAITPLVTFSPFAIAALIQSLAVLDYLGLGLKPPTPSWGELISQAQRHFTHAEWLAWYPSAALLLTMTAFLSIGLAARDALDSKS